MKTAVIFNIIYSSRSMSVYVNEHGAELPKELSNLLELTDA